ncbi:hypothetical protein RvY_04458 [Ramazzottius varieornatus]|uniref:Uncharacterized protein n=1 Tax=Ramazzottius varieornatus TaxID=947166 RepID=A0A1D1USD4_RAMVA|nr:hypothetical protein RvY_04458 [Ramazzottius varieornatus]
MVKKQNKVKRKADTQKMDKKPSTNTSSIESVVDLTTSSENCVPPPSPFAGSELSISVGTTNVRVPNLKKSTGGRKKDSPVWNFFKYDEEGDQSTCMVEGSSKQLTSCSAAKNRVHLHKHPAAYKEYLELLAKQKAEREKDSISGVSFKQVTLEEMAQSGKPYDKNHLSTLQKVALYVLRSPSMTLNGVEDESFHDLIHHLDYRAPLPIRKTVRGFMDSTEERLRETIEDLLKNAGKICLTTDICTKERYDRSIPRDHRPFHRREESCQASHVRLCLFSVSPYGR